MMIHEDKIFQMNIWHSYIETPRLTEENRAIYRGHRAKNIGINSDCIINETQKFKMD